MIYGVVLQVTLDFNVETASFITYKHLALFSLLIHSSFLVSSETYYITTNCSI